MPSRSYACKYTWRHVHFTALGSSTPVPAPASLAAIPLSLSAIPLIPSTAVAATSSFQPVYSGALAPTLPPITTYGAVASVSSTDPKPKAVPFKVASNIVPIPAKLVKRIQALEFVDMRELLLDNIALAERLAALPPGLAPPKPPGEREIRGDRALVTCNLCRHRGSGTPRACGRHAGVHAPHRP